MTEKPDKGKEAKDAGQHRHQKHNLQKNKQKRHDYKTKMIRTPKKSQY